MLDPGKCAQFSPLLLAYLFGSQAKGKPRAESDTDIAVLLEEPIKDKIQIRLDLLEFFQKEFSREVDITILNTAGTVLKYQVAKNGQLLFEREEGLARNFRVNAWKEYFDFQPTLEFFYKRKVA